MAEITYLEAIREALFEEMERDANVFMIGEDIGAYGGAFFTSLITTSSLIIDGQRQQRR